ncbi:hypothetical protein PVK06_030219 [Gossypium arboreum]|uniref:Uncharacterized protein n=1 Tax=Gossypium arboreum TaxID=29729 RepID=A0ABR0NNK6_GOSAR|nr:hypothetical protein PVK06_030219 [Gossypium arboreum]
MHTEPKAKYVLPAFDHCFMPLSQCSYVSNRAIYEIFEERDWGKPLRPKGTNVEEEEDEEEEEEEEVISIVPLDYERVFQPDHSSTKGMVICDSSHYSSSQTSGRQTTKVLVRGKWGKAPIVEKSEPDSD